MSYVVVEHVVLRVYFDSVSVVSLCVKIGRVMSLLCRGCVSKVLSVGQGADEGI